MAACMASRGVEKTGELWGPGLGEQISFAKDFYSKSPLSVLVPAVGIFLLVYSFGKSKWGKFAILDFNDLLLQFLF